MGFRDPVGPHQVAPAVLDLVGQPLGAAGKAFGPFDMGDWAAVAVVAATLDPAGVNLRLDFATPGSTQLLGATGRIPAASAIGLSGIFPVLGEQLTVTLKPDGNTTLTNLAVIPLRTLPPPGAAAQFPRRLVGDLGIAFVLEAMGEPVGAGATVTVLGGASLGPATLAVAGSGGAATTTWAANLWADDGTDLHLLAQLTPTQRVAQVELPPFPLQLDFANLAGTAGTFFATVTARS